MRAAPRAPREATGVGAGPGARRRPSAAALLDSPSPSACEHSLSPAPLPSPPSIPLSGSGSAPPPAHAGASRAPQTPLSSVCRDLRPPRSFPLPSALTSDPGEDATPQLSRYCWPAGVGVGARHLGPPSVTQGLAPPPAEPPVPSAKRPACSEASPPSRPRQLQLFPGKQVDPKAT